MDVPCAGICLEGLLEVSKRRKTGYGYHGHLGIWTILPITTKTSQMVLSSDCPVLVVPDGSG